MSRVDLWQAIGGQADAWRDLTCVARFRTQLPRNVSQRSKGLPGRLQELQANGAWMGSRPLLVGSMIQLIDSMPWSTGTQGDRAHFEAWLADALRLEEAHRETVAWLRSRFPGYPLIPAVHLVPGTANTTREFTWRLVWPRGDFGRGLQFQAAPVRVGELLGVSASEQKALNASAQLVARALESTVEWDRFAHAARALDRDALAELTDARAALKSRLSDAMVSEFEPNNAVRRYEYRASTLVGVVGALSGAALEYSEAFSALNDLVEYAVSDVFGQLAIYGPPELISGGRDLELSGGKTGEVAFTLMGTPFMETGSLIWLDDPLVRDALYVVSASMSWSDPDPLVMRLKCKVVDGSREAWSGSSNR